MNSRGRPPLPRKSVRSSHRKVSLTVPEAEVVDRSAKAAGMSVSSWLRMVVRRFLGVE